MTYLNFCLTIVIVIEERNNYIEIIIFPIESRVLFTILSENNFFYKQNIRLYFKLLLKPIK